MADPSAQGPPGDVVSSGGGGRGRRRFPGWLAVAVAAVALIGLARLTSTEPARAPSPAAAPSTSPPVTPSPAATRAVDQEGHGLPLPDVAGAVQDVALAGDSLYVVQTPPTRLLRLSVDGRRVEGTRRVPAAADHVAVDVAKRIVWVWTADRDVTVVQAYDARTLRPIGRSRFGEQSFGGAAYGGRLWLGAAVDFVRLAPGGHPQRVVSANYVFDAAADPAHQRVLATLGDAVAAYDARTMRLVARAPVSLGKPSLAVVGGDVWVAGFSDRGRKVLHLDGASLRPVPRRRQAGVSVGPGAVVWPGSRSVFVADGGSEEVTCVDAATGAPLTTWEGIMGPVAAQNRVAFAVVGQGVVPLVLGQRCPG